MKTRLPIKGPHLNGFDVIFVQFRLGFKSSVERRHQGCSAVAVRQAQGVAEFVGCGLEQVGAWNRKKGLANGERKDNIRYSTRST